MQSTITLCQCERPRLPGTKSKEEQSQKIARRTRITDYQVSLFILTIILL
ncbi:hypothetical protein C1H46_019440 [Malus baccata]|uniref:Uncharacterized protein n=1 Tax=Malus baccata TaxID=106549 RepID=A0A540M898_MALBA|nr:hypothetical protein C1H46_019440 [Malus baccata]